MAKRGTTFIENLEGVRFNGLPFFIAAIIMVGVVVLAFWCFLASLV